MHYFSDRIVVRTLRQLFLGFAAVAFTAAAGRADEPAANATPTPRIHSANPRVPAGHVVRLNGSDFGGRELWYSGPPLYVDGKYLTVEGWGEDRIYVRIPTTVEAGEHSVKVLNHRVRSNTLRILVVPIIEEISSSKDNGRDILVLSGGGFGSGKPADTVTFAGQTVEPVRWTPTEIYVPAPAPPAAGTEPMYVVTVNGLQAELAYTGTPAPLATESLVVAGMTETHLVVTGQYFGQLIDTDNVTIRGLAAKILGWEDDNITVAVPNDLPAGTYPVVLTARGYKVEAPDLNVIPVVRGLSYADGHPGDDLELLGAHFPKEKADVKVSIADASAEIIGVSPERIHIKIPQGVVTGKQMIRVSVASGAFQSPAVPFKVLPKKPGVVTFEKFGDNKDNGF